MSKPNPADMPLTGGITTTTCSLVVGCAGAFGMAWADANADDTHVLSRGVYRAPKSLITVGLVLPAGGGKGALADASFSAELGALGCLRRRTA